MFDLENSEEQQIETIRTVAGFLEVDPGAGELLLAVPGDYETEPHFLEVCQAMQPDLIIVDPLNAVFRYVEASNESAGEALQKIRALLRATGASLIGVHHVRKPHREPGYKPPDLAGREYRRFFEEARGPRVLINGSDLRLGLQERRDDWMLLRGFTRITGDTGKIWLRRNYIDGDPQGYYTDPDGPKESVGASRRPPTAAAGRSPSILADLLRKGPARTQS